MVRSAIENRPLPVYGKVENVRDWIHVEDHCEGIRLAWEKGRIGERYCFGGGEEYSNLELVRMLCRHLDDLAPRKDGAPHDSRIQFVEDRLGHDWRYAIDDSHARSVLGFHPKHSLKSSFRETIRSYL
jgi:dTDP-glucose 4,6-dehydratase